MLLTESECAICSSEEALTEESYDSEGGGSVASEALSEAAAAMDALGGAATPIARPDSEADGRPDEPPLPPPDGDPDQELPPFEMSVFVPLRKPPASSGDITAVKVGKFGVIRYYAMRHQFVAECTCRGHDRCFFSRSADVSAAIGRESQGRPLGLMLAWLVTLPHDITKFNHVFCKLPSFEVRSKCRAAGLAQAASVPVVAELFSKERPPRAADIAGEPVDAV